GGSRVELDSNPPTADPATPGAGLAARPEEPEEPVTEEPVEPEPPEEPPPPDSHTVGSGESLESIAAGYGLEWRLLFDANDDVERPDLLLKGQVLAIPPPDADLPRRELPKPPEPEPLVTALNDSGTSGESAEEPPPSQPQAVPDGSVWDRLAQCESGGNWSINTGNGYYGGLQFSQSSWQGVGGTGLPSEHSREEQIRRGETLQARQGWGAWPSCARKLGLI
ncbi:MAG: LysM peptidoglycan-binding domain-containing protein, partial [Nitriliruptorales bacterium]|nr:LysM peptidoglycan-binding domain-containing protein [Nitriliruptorales bacterium]